MSDNCPKCGFELKDFYTKKIELELKSKFDQKQKKLLGELNDELEAEKLKNSLLEEKSKRNKELLKEKIKTELSAEFSAKELSYQKNQINLEGKISQLEQNKKTEIELNVASNLPLGKLVSGVYSGLVEIYMYHFGSREFSLSLSLASFESTNK